MSIIPPQSRSERILRQAARPSTLFLACGFVVAVWVVWPLLIRHYVSNWQTRGLAGDMFGGLNTLFTGLAFAGLIYTIFLGKLEKLENDRDNAETRAREAKTSFEQTLFQLVNSWNLLTNSIELIRGNIPRTYRGREALRYMAGEAGDKVQEEKLLGSKLDASVVNRLWIEFYDGEGYGLWLGHYYRTLHRIFLLISSSDRTDQQFYAHFVRAQLSDAELTLLFYDGLSGYGNGIKDHIEKYALLEHVPGATRGFAELRGAYKVGAYGTR